MKLLTHLLVLLFVATACHADPTDEEQKFLTIEGASPKFRPAQEETFIRNQLPKELVSILAGYDWGRDDGKLPDRFAGYAMDLNGDGTNEYFIRTIFGGSGGPAFTVLTKTAKGWRTILDFQGGFGVIPVKSGWPKFVSTSGGGGGNFSKIHYVFHRGAYHPTLHEGYTRGALSEKIIPLPSR